MNVLEVINLKKTYKGGIKAVDNISFEIKRGEIVGLLGPNGAGKTTTIKCISTLIIPDSGQILIKGKDALKNPSFALKNIASVLEGNRNIYWRLNVRDNLEFFASLQGFSLRKVKNKIEELIDFFNLREKEKKEARFLSRGMQQKLAVACAFVKDTEIILLDEPTLGLDVETTRELKELIRKKAKEESKTLIVSSHNMKLIEDICDIVIIINRGKIVAIDSIENLKKFFGYKAFNFEIEGKIDENIKKEFKEKFELVKFIENEYNTNMEIELKSIEIIYDVIEMMRNKNFRLKKFEEITPDFEEIYLKIVKNE
ncbi:MAG: ABC transporter ATP-binding protein [Candidatus Omnitrophica bacterium]|nr:ABC transporter ATP-binding protein [Candidatus Omnitrophota bacterium]